MTDATYVSRGYVNERRFSLMGRRRANPKHGEWWGSAYDRAIAELVQKECEEQARLWAWFLGEPGALEWMFPDDAARPRTVTLSCSAPGFNVRISV